MFRTISFSLVGLTLLSGAWSFAPTRTVKSRLPLTSVNLYVDHGWHGSFGSSPSIRDHQHFDAVPRHFGPPDARNGHGIGRWELEEQRHFHDDRAMFHDDGFYPIHNGAFEPFHEEDMMHSSVFHPLRHFDDRRMVDELDGYNHDMMPEMMGQAEHSFRPDVPLNSNEASSGAMLSQEQIHFNVPSRERPTMRTSAIAQPDTPLNSNEASPSGAALFDSSYSDRESRSPSHYGASYERGHYGMNFQSAHQPAMYEFF